MLYHCFGPLGLHRVEALVELPNRPSAKLLRRLGFQLEGVPRACYCRGSTFHDHQLFSCLHGELVSERG
jgi:ribosomal-protein-alanine N-acetyltransferase